MEMRARRRVSPGELRAERAAVDDPEVVLAAALRFLEARQRSAAEVRRRLTFAGYREELVTGALERLTELGVLDDAAFAQSWVESRDRARPRGARALRAELAQKGIDRQLVDDVIAERGDVSDAVGARRRLEQHARTLERITDPRARRQRAYTLLARSGFESETIAEVLREPESL